MALTFYSVDECKIKAYKILRDKGFRSDRSPFKFDSVYLMKQGYMGRKIRVSNHDPITHLAYDVAANITFTQPTIINDIEYQVNQAIKKYEKFKKRT